MEIKLSINDYAKEKMKEQNLKDKYMKLYYSGFGWTAGLQMVFDENIDDEYKVYDVEGYKVGICKDIIDSYDYIEIKYSDNFISQGFYPCIVRPEDSASK